MAESEEKPISTLGRHLTGLSDDSTTKPITRKKKNTRKQRHGESTWSRYSSNIELKIMLIILVCEGTSSQLH